MTVSKSSTGLVFSESVCVCVCKDESMLVCYVWCMPSFGVRVGEGEAERSQRF